MTSQPISSSPADPEGLDSGSVRCRALTARRRERATWSDRRVSLYNLLCSVYFRVVIVVIIMLNCGLMMHEVDLRADDMTPEPWTRTATYIFVSVYAIECSAKLYIYRLFFFMDLSCILDLAVLVVDLLAILMNLMVEDASSLAVVRIIRIVKVSRLFRFLVVFRELHMMLHGLLSTLKAIGWAAIFLLLVLSVCSTFAVEVLHPLNIRVAEDGVYDDCEWCKVAFSSVLYSNLTFFSNDRSR